MKINEVKSLSVIIPTYNSSKTIIEAISSVIDNLDNVQVIVVNDGSTDDTIENIQDEFKGYNNIKIINKDNGGVSSARNEGLKYVETSHVMFLDSDDSLTKEIKGFIKSSFEKNQDISIGNYSRVHSTKTEPMFLKEYIGEINSFLTYYINSDKANHLESSCFKIYKMSIINNHHMNFNNNLSFGEDTIFNLQYIRESKTIYFDERIIYNYNLQNNEKSLTKTVNNEILISYYEIYTNFQNLFVEHSILKYEGYLNELFLRGVKSYLIMVTIDDLLTKKEKLELIKNIKLPNTIYKYSSKNLKNKILVILLIKRRFKILLLLLKMAYRKKANY